jgi:transcriptional regulator with GAF, ATPase, and Fis domain
MLAPEPNSSSLKAFRQSRDEEEARMILSVLQSTKWNRKRAARSLNMDYKALLYRMKRLGIDTARGEDLRLAETPTSAIGNRL